MDPLDITLDSIFLSSLPFSSHHVNFFRQFNYAIENILPYINFGSRYLVDLIIFILYIFHFISFIGCLFKRIRKIILPQIKLKFLHSTLDKLSPNILRYRSTVQLFLNRFMAIDAEKGMSNEIMS